MQAKEMTLKPILEGEKQYLVPLYQRTYAWQTPQLERLWTDILAQADTVDAPSIPGHFVGSLVLAPAADPARTDSPTDVLRAEGIRFTGKGRADPAQRLSPLDLAALIGVEVPEEATSSTDQRRFWLQLDANQPPPVRDAVRRLLDDWRSRGGTLSWGTGAQTSCFPVIRTPEHESWPWTLKPTSGVVEVVFQHLAVRPPFDDTAVRDELRQRINTIPGVTIPSSRLELRPSFSLALVATDAGVERALSVQQWFLDQPAPRSGRHTHPTTP